MQYQVFLSHSTRTEQNTHIERIVEGVFQCLNDSGHPTYWDWEFMSENVPLIPELSSRIEGARVAVIFLTKLAESSGFVELEMELIRQRRDAGKIEVRVVVFDDDVRPALWLSTSELIHPRRPIMVETTALEVCREILRLLR